MTPGTVPLPEPFGSALGAGEPARVVDSEAATPEALFARACARSLVGRRAEARADLLNAAPALGDPCRIELALLAIQAREDVEEALTTAREIAGRADAAPALRARALHVLGLAEARLRRSDSARAHLLAAARLYRELRDRLGCARVFDTLGMLEAAIGRLDHALPFYAL